MDVLSVIGLLVSYYTRYVSKSFEITSMKYPRRFSSVSCTVPIQLGRSLIHNSKKKKKVNIKGELWGVLIKSSCSSLVRFFIIFFRKNMKIYFRIVKFFLKLRSTIFENFWQVDRSIIETVDRIILDQSMVCNWAIIGRSIIGQWSINDHLLIHR